MLVLVLDTATPAITAAVAELTDSGEQVLSERVTVNARAHGELLAPQIQAVLTSTNTRPEDLVAVIAGVGPGPYTGLRAGLVTAVSFSLALDIPAYGVPTLDAIGAATTGRVLVATDARRKEVYYATFTDGHRAGGAVGVVPSGGADGSSTSLIAGTIGVAKPADLAPLIAANDLVAAVGEGAEKYAEVLGLPVGEPLYPPALQLARLAAARVRAKAPTEPLTPLYLRKPDAVEPGARKPVLT